MITHGLSGVFKTGTYAVTHNAPGGNVGGYWVDGTPTVTNLDAAIQPTIGRELLTFTTEQRTEEIRQMLTVGVVLEDDVVTINSEPWVCIRSGSWTLRGATWTRAYLARRKVTVGVAS